MKGLKLRKISIFGIFVKEREYKKKYKKRGRYKKIKEGEYEQEENIKRGRDISKREIYYFIVEKLVKRIRIKLRMLSTHDDSEIFWIVW